MFNPTIVYFGSAPTTILMQHSANMTGIAYGPSVVPAIRPGIYEFAAQDCGKFAFHDVPIVVKNISYKGGGTLTVTKHLLSNDAQIGALPAITTSDYMEDIFLGPGEYLKFVTSGATNPKVAITSRVAQSEWMN